MDKIIKTNLMWFRSKEMWTLPNHLVYLLTNIFEVPWRCVFFQFESVVSSVMIHFSVIVMETHLTPLCYVKYTDISSRAESISWPFPLLFAF